MQGQRKPAAPRTTGEPRANASGRTLDVNRERLVFCLTSLTGNRVTVKLRNSVTYEGLFYSCSLDSDYSITLKHARQLPSENLKSGEVIPTLVIPGKDFLQVSAIDVPSPVCSDGDAGGIVANTQGAFATDMDIAQRKAHTGGERELVAWAPAEGDIVDGGGLEDEPIGHHAPQPWDQFSANKDMFGIASTWNEELYTTKLDTSTIPREKREEAERIAREIESGQCAAEVDGRIEGTADADGDEENAFSAVARRKAAGSQNTELPAGVPLTKDALSQHDNLSGQDGFAREHRAKRGMITAHSPMRSPMISEMKRINALNLEPALPKLDDKTRNDWINFKQSQNKSAGKSVQGNGLKHEFQQSLEQIQKDTAAAHTGQASMNKDKALEQIRKELAKAQTGSPTTGADSAAPGALEAGRRAQQKPTLPLPGHGAAAAAERKSFTFNPGAKEFTFNPGASSFTPQNSGAPASSAPAQPSSPQVAKTPSATPAPQFKPFEVNSEFLKKSLEQVLDTFYDKGTGEKTWTVAPDWPDVGHMSFKEVLGAPNPSNPLPPVGAIAAGGGTMPGGWQGQAPGQMAPVTPGGSAAPGQMVPQGFMVAPNATGGGQQQMYQPIYPGPGGAVPVRPQGSGGMMQQPVMVFNQQTIMGGQGSMMPAGMVGQQGGNTPGGSVGMAPVPKFGGQVAPGMVMAPVGQFPQGFVPQQAMGQPGQQAPQGQPGQPGGPAPPPAQ